MKFNFIWNECQKSEAILTESEHGNNAFLPLNFLNKFNFLNTDLLLTTRLYYNLNIYCVNIFARFSAKRFCNNKNLHTQTSGTSCEHVCMCINIQTRNYTKCIYVYFMNKAYWRLGNYKYTNCYSCSAVSCIYTQDS